MSVFEAYSDSKTDLHDCNNSEQLCGISVSRRRRKVGLSPGSDTNDNQETLHTHILTEVGWLGGIGGVLGDEEARVWSRPLERGWR